MATVTVEDNVLAVINSCPSDFSVAPDDNDMFSLEDYITMITASDNCSNSTAIVLTQSPIAGTLVGLGDTEIILTAEDGEGNQSECRFIVTVDQSLSVDDEDIVDGMTIYPNPIQDYLNIEFRNSSVLRGLKIVDITGRIVYEVSSNQLPRGSRGQYQLDVSRLPNATYFVLIETMTSSLTKKFVKGTR